MVLRYTVDYLSQIAVPIRIFSIIDTIYIFVAVTKLTNYVIEKPFILQSDQKMPFSYLKIRNKFKKQLELFWQQGLFYSFILINLEFFKKKNFKDN